MSYSYDPSLTKDKDWVRFLAGDRDISRARVEDEEIYAILQEEPNRYYAAARVCELILVRSNGLVMKQVGDLRLQFSDSPETTYTNYIKKLREEGAYRLAPRPKFFRVF